MVKIAQHSTAWRVIHAQAGEIYYNRWSLVWLGILGTWHFFYGGSTIPMLTSCFISNYRAQVSPIQATHCRPVARSTPSPFCEVSSNCTPSCIFTPLYQLVYRCLQVSTTRKSSSPCPAVLVSDLLSIYQDIHQNIPSYRSPSYVNTPWSVSYLFQVQSSPFLERC